MTTDQLRVIVRNGALTLAVVVAAAGCARPRPAGSARSRPSPRLSLGASTRAGRPATSRVDTAPVRLAGGVLVGHSLRNDTSRPLREVPPVASRGRAAREARLDPHAGHAHASAKGRDITLQPFAAPPNMPAASLSFDGIARTGAGCACTPPDTDGEAGLTQYVAMVNQAYQVFDKATGASLYGPVDIATLWSGFGGDCDGFGLGEPVVLYDQLAGRWLISQISGSTTVSHECLAVSTTGDATGSFNRYEFDLGTDYFDYPHLGVWPDGYYLSANVFDPDDFSYLGPQPFVFGRAAMLAGSPATFISTGITNGPAEETYLPADVDGAAPPPAGAPNPFVVWPGSGTYRVFHFHADWTTPANSTFTLFSAPAAAPFALAADVPQSGTGSTLTALGDRLMFRNGYRNFRDHEALVLNYTVGSGGVAGVRWVELRDVTNGPVTVFQESTYQPDTTWRFMGSAAMDGSGDLAVGFSASSASVFPEVRYAGRLAADAPNTLAQGEATLHAGTGSQVGSDGRWGDYSAMSIDPVDDCTFFYTNEYYATTTSDAWKTRVGSFRFPSCTTPIAGATSVIAGDADNDADTFPGYTYSVPPAAGTTFTWSVSSGGSVLSGQGTNVVRVAYDSSAGPFTVSVVATGAVSYSSALANITKANTGFDWDFTGTGTAPGWTAEVGSWAQQGDGTFADVTSATTVARYESASYGQVYGDFTLEAELVATRPAEPAASNGLFVCGTPAPLGQSKIWNAGYLFNIATTGKFSIYRMVNGTPQTVQAWTTPVGTSIAGSALPNTLKVTASGGTLTFFVNGVAVKTVTGSPVPSGKVGIGMVRSKPAPPALDKLAVRFARVTTGEAAAPVGAADRSRVSAAQEAANGKANERGKRSDPLFDDSRH